MVQTDRSSRYLFISAHLDDAVLSCGACIGNLARTGRRVDILTVFAGVPEPRQITDLSRWFHRNCGLGDDAIRVRRGEDKTAAGLLGARTTHLTLFECLYRRDVKGSPKYTKIGQIFEADPGFEADTVDRIASALRKMVIRRDYRTIYVPMGIGRHIDHLLVRVAAESLGNRMATDGSPAAVYYEDLPYASRNCDPNWQATLAQDMRPEVRLIDDLAWKTKIAAISAYQSQVRMMWPGIADMVYELRSYALHVGAGEPAERFWVKGHGGDPLVAACIKEQDVKTGDLLERVNNLSPEKRALLTLHLRSQSASVPLVSNDPKPNDNASDPQEMNTKGSS